MVRPVTTATLTTTTDAHQHARTSHAGMGLCKLEKDVMMEETRLETVVTSLVLLKSAATARCKLERRVMMATL
jgi:hypothetical protein